MHRFFFRLGLFILVFWVCLPGAEAQRVGVVLSGGGAKGVAHVGVLKALEAYNIPIDYIAGTSMGAIIGGMYASGLSPDSIETIVTSPDFQNWALGTIEEEFHFFYKQPSPNASWINLRFRVDSIWQPRLPTNLVSPVQMDFAGLQYLTAPTVVSGGDFNRLFVPFRCVAADIWEKKAVVFDSGDLYPAIRASMTYPFVFRPIRVDGRLLFDGGIYNNFPVDVMIADFDPDFIVGSVVSANFPPPTEDNVRSHIENMLVYQTDYEIPEGMGLVVKPQLPETGVTDFSRSASFVDSGYVAVSRKLEQLKAQIEREVSAPEREAARQAFLDKKPPMVFDRILIRGLNEAQRSYLNRVLLHQGQPTPIEEIRTEYFKLLSEEHIESIHPSAMFNPETGYYDLYLDVRLNKDLQLQFGGNVSSSPVNFAFVEAKYKHLAYQAYMGSVSAHFGRFYSAVQLQGRIDFALPIPVFLKTTGSFNYYDYFRSTTTFFQDRNPSYILQNQNYWDIRAGVPAKYPGKFQLGFTTGRNRDDYYQTNLFSRTDIADRTVFRYASPFVQFERNTLNRKQYPNRGTYLSLLGRFVTGTEQHNPGSTSTLTTRFRDTHNWLQFRATYQNFFSVDQAMKYGFFSELVLSGKPFFNNYTSSLLSAPHFDYLPGSRTLFLPRYRANSFLVVGFQGVYSITENIDLRLEPYVFQPFREILEDEENRAFQGPRLDNRYLLISTAIIVNTPIGPLGLTLNYFDRNEHRLSFTFNFGYLIFNPKPLR
jgi:NTE family protein